MSRENVEAIRAAFEAWQRGDIDAWVAAIDPMIEWDSSAYRVVGVDERGQGRESFLSRLDRYWSSWDRYDATIKELIDADDNVVIVLHETVRAGGSDAPIERDLVQVWTIREARAVRFRAFPTKAEALEAAGLEE
jgi:ketosteroid isomerase-like protein